MFTIDTGYDQLKLFPKSIVLITYVSKLSVAPKLYNIE